MIKLSVRDGVSYVSKKNLEEKMSSMGVKYTIDDDSFEMFPPKGYIFKANDLHSYLINELRLVNEPITRAEIYSWAMEILNYGLNKCANPECDICDEND